MLHLCFPTLRGANMGKLALQPKIDQTSPKTVKKNIHPMLLKISPQRVMFVQHLFPGARAGKVLSLIQIQKTLVTSLVV